MLAILYDIHGNLGALEAVLADAESAGAASYLLGGDYALFGPRPAATVERLRALDAEWLRGNGERWTARPREAPGDEVVQTAIEACRAELGERTTEELAALRESIVHAGAAYWHASPASDVRSFWPEPGEDEGELLDGTRTGRLVFGHTHLPFRRRAVEGEVELVNPGSVGMPFDGDPRAAYALLHDDGTLEPRRVTYDHEASAAELRERFDAPFVETVARRIEQATPGV